MSPDPTFATPLAAAAAAQAAAPAGGGGGSADLIGMVPWILLLAIWFYFLIWRPQRQRAKQLADMVAGLKKGDEVITAGGIRGRIVRLVDDSDVEVEIAQGVKVRVIKTTLGSVVTPGGKAAND